MCGSVRRAVSTGIRFAAMPSRMRLKSLISKILTILCRYPEASPEACDAELRLMAEDLKLELPPPAERYPLRMIAAINKFLFEERGFKKNGGAVSDEMLCLNNVLRTKMGEAIRRLRGPDLTLFEVPWTWRFKRVPCQCS